MKKYYTGNNDEGFDRAYKWTIFGSAFAAACGLARLIMYLVEGK